MKRALIVGSRGQDGRLLRAFLSARGYAIIGLSRQAEERSDGRLAPPVDLADPAALAALVARVAHYLAAFHHASQQIPDLPPSLLWRESMAVNADAVVFLLEALRQHAPAARFFYAGSCLSFGEPKTNPQTEDTCLAPRCVYGITKTAGILAVRLYRETHGLFAVAGILYNHESHLRPESFLSRLLRNSRRSLCSSFFRLSRRQPRLIFLPIQDGCAPLAAFVSQRGQVRSAGGLEDRLFQIEGHGIEQKLQFNLGQTEVSGSKEAVATLESAEGALHL